MEKLEKKIMVIGFTFYLMVWLLFVVTFTGCQTLTPITLEGCNYACHPGRVDRVEVKHGVCECAPRRK